MDKINLVLSSSQQAHNQCVIGDKEQDHTQLITQYILSKMSRDIRLNVFCIPKQTKADDRANLIECVRLSNEFINRNGGKGFHLSIHTDAGYNGTGASGFYASEAGKCFGLRIYEEISALTPWKDMAFKERDGLYELRGTQAVAFLLEIAFHDKCDQAKWIHDNIEAIADAIIRGIYKGVGLDPYKETDIELENALNFISLKSGIDYDKWLGIAQSNTTPNLGTCFKKIAVAWKKDYSNPL